MEVLLTNDDGYDSPGLHAIAQALGETADVMIVAPTEDRSAMGRARSRDVSIDSRPAGYAVSGTPVDSVLVGIEALDLDPDIVVSGCNVGANVGSHSMGSSGTVSAAVEATFFGIPAIAVSMYVPPADWPLDPELPHFEEAMRVTPYLVDHLVDTQAVPEGGYLNVNVPMAGETPAAIRLTTLSDVYDMAANRDGDRIVLRDRGWEERQTVDIVDPPSTDRGAILRGNISVTTLTARHSPVEMDGLRHLLEEYDGSVAQTVVPSPDSGGST